MCGIMGLIDFNEDAGRYTDVYDEVLHRLHRRGPDEYGSFLSKEVCLIHTRLSVVDIENGKQPMIYEKDECKIILVYNGELYNTEDLRSELHGLGHVFEELSDTEVLLHSYMEWSEDCVNKLNGIYAFAIWDSKKQILFAARDRMGVKPFFYSIVNGEFIFASEIKALLCHPLIHPAIDKKGIAELLLIGPGRTSGDGIFHQIKELKPGNYAIFSKNKGLSIKPYWKLEAREHTHNFDETVEVVKFLVEDSIKRQSVADVPLCTFLSGGLDSSTISALSGVKHTFSVDYSENEKYFTSSYYQPKSDSEYIKKMTDFLGTKHTKIVIETDELVNALFDAVEARDLPGMADVDSSLLLFCKSVKEYATVALSGECADEIFGGYPWYRNEDLLNRNGFPWSQSIGYRASFIKKELRNEINPEDYVQQKYDKTINETEYIEKETDREKRMKQMFRLNTQWFMQTLLDRKDRMSMYSGLEVRVPFCDHRLTEYLYNVPWEYKNYKGREKGLLREALKGMLPEEVLWRKKSPYPKTHHPDYLKKVSDILSDILYSSSAPIFNIVDKTSLETLLNNSNSHIPWYGQLMTIPQTIAYFIQLNTWMEKYTVKII